MLCLAEREAGQRRAMHVFSIRGSGCELRDRQQIPKLVNVRHRLECQSFEDMVSLVMAKCYVMLQGLPDRKVLFMFNCNNKASKTGINKGEVPDII